MLPLSLWLNQCFGFDTILVTWSLEVNKYRRDSNPGPLNEKRNRPRTRPLCQAWPKPNTQKCCEIKTGFFVQRLRMSSDSKLKLPTKSGSGSESDVSVALSRRMKTISVALLCFVNLINYMDRYTVSSEPLSIFLLKSSGFPWSVETLVTGEEGSYRPLC